MKHIVGFSGGIDSQACARWVLNRHAPDDVILLNSDAGGNEHWMTTKFIADYSAKVHPVVTISATLADLHDSPGVVERSGLPLDTPLTFELLGKLKGRFPSTKARFCSAYLKLVPQKRWIEANIDSDFVRYTGVRRDEGRPNDRRTGRFYTPMEEDDDFLGCLIRHPVCDWTKQMCFDYVKAHREDVNPLYALGFDRVGCSPCINATKEDVRNWATRFPDVIDKIRALERSVGAAFFPPGMMPGKNVAFIDDVVEWSRTVRGGRQLSLLADVVEPCSSKYGLCE